MPKVQACLFDLKEREVEYIKSQKVFDTRDDCITDALQNFPDVPLSYDGPYLYVMEYDAKTGILVKCTRSVGMPCAWRQSKHYEYV